MICSKCQADNPNQAKFCNNCGHKFLGICTHCGTQNPENAKFCNECGKNLNARGSDNEAVERTSKSQIHENNGDKNSEDSVRRTSELKGGAQPTSTKTSADKAERRQLTCLFCDLVGSTTIASEMDAEDYRQYILEYQRTAERVIRQYHGHVGNYLGDGLLVYFGYPKGIEHAPRTAVTCGLAIIEAIAEHNAISSSKKRPVHVRMGIHVGLVVVDDQMALGSTVNVAARLEGLAETNTVVISVAIKKLVEGWFQIKSIGTHSLKGIATSMEVFQVIEESGASTRLEVGKQRGLSPLVGRDLEVNMILRSWNLAKDGKGQFLLIKGEAGIGKSRLIEQIKTKVKQEDSFAKLELHCSDYHVNSTFYPIIDLFERKILPIDKKDTPAEKMSKLENWLEFSMLTKDPHLPIFADYLSISISEEQRATYTSSHLSPALRKNIFIEGFTNALFNFANVQPLLLIVEDLHWMDASTREWLEQCIPWIHAHPIFILATGRPQFEPSWSNKSNIAELRLNHLPTNTIEAICLHQTQGKTLPKEVLAEIKNKTDGIPLFVEELTRSIIESGVLVEKEDQFELKGVLKNLSIPSSLQGSLNARLDNLSEGKEIAQIGAIIGREFSYEWIAVLTQKDDVDIQRTLKELINAELLYQRGGGTDAIYIFKHALIQDAAYESLLKSTRRQLHSRVLKAIEARFPDIASSQPEVLAHHMSQAGLHEQAMVKWEEAGNIAFQRFSNFEALHHFEKAISMLSYVGDREKREVKELDLLLPYISVIMLTKGWMHPSVKKNAERIMALCQANPRSKKSLIGFYGLGSFAHVEGNALTALHFYQKGADMAQDINEDGFAAFFFALLADMFMFIGNFKSALHSSRQAIELYDPQLHKEVSLLGSGDIKILATHKGSDNLLVLGFPDTAQKNMDEIAEHALTCNDLSSQFRRCLTPAIRYLLLSEYQKSKVALEALLPQLEVSGEWALFGMLNSLYLTTIAIIEGGEAIEKAQVFGDELMEAGMCICRSGFDTWLLIAYLKARDYEGGMKCVGYIKAIMKKTDEIWIRGEMYRLKGELHLLKDNEQAEAESSFLKSIEITQSQSAKWFEMKAAKSLARLWQSQGKSTEAYELLSGVYNWFTEGFDTLDMREAKELLGAIETELN